MSIADLTGDEVALCRAVQSGLTFRGDELSPPVIRSDVVKHLIVGKTININGHEIVISEALTTGLDISYAIISGPLVLDNAADPNGEFLPPLVLSNCTLGDVSMRRARFRHLSLAHSRLRHLDACGLQVDGDVNLSMISSSEVGETLSGAGGRGLCWIEMREARFSGCFQAAGSRFVSPPKNYKTPSVVIRAKYALDLRASTIDGEVILWPGFSAYGGVNIRSAVIDRDFIASGATLYAVDDQALAAAGARIGGSALLIVWPVGEEIRPFVAEGPVSFLDSSIGGSLDLRGAIVNSFTANNSRIGGAALLGSGDDRDGTIGFDCSGPVSLDASTIGGSLNLTGARVHTLNVENANVGGSIFLTTWSSSNGVRHFSAYDGVYLRGTMITGNIDARGASTFTFKADNITVGGAVFLRQWYSGEDDAFPFIVQKDVSLVGSRISGNLEMTGACAHDIFIVNAEIRGGVLCNAWRKAENIINFKVMNILSLSGTHIGGSLELSGADVGSLEIQNAEVGGSIFLCALTTKEPTTDCAIPYIGRAGIFIAGSRFGADLDLSGSTFLGQISVINTTIGGSVWLQDYRGSALTLRASIDFSGTRVGNRLVVRKLDLADAPPVKVDLSHCTVMVLDDQNGDAWGENLTLDLQGFCYDRMAVAYTEGTHRPWLSYPREADDAPNTGVSRLAWLNLQYPPGNRKPNFADYSPDAYDRLARAFRASGHYGDARLIIREKLRVERQVLKGPFTRPFLYIFATFFDSGLSPKRALATFVGFVLLGGFAVLVADRGVEFLNMPAVLVLDTSTVNSLVVTRESDGTLKPGLLIADKSHAAVDEIRCGDEIEPFLYALDVFTPALELHQERRCSITTGPAGWLWRFGRAAYAIMGWVVTALTVLTVSGVTRRHLEE